MKQFGLFNEEDYKKRLLLLRAMYGETQEAFADRLEIPRKRWSQYERGYPMPRETAWAIRQKLWPRIAEWIWFGDEEGIPDLFRKRLRDTERTMREAAEAKAKALREARKDAKRALRKIKQRGVG